MPRITAHFTGPRPTRWSVELYTFVQLLVLRLSHAGPKIRANSEQ